VVSTFVSGLYNLVLLVRSKKYDFGTVYRIIFEPKVVKTGAYIVGFSAALIAAKTMAMRIAPNPGYVVTLLLTAPVFIYLLSPQNKMNSGFTDKAGVAMLFFLGLVMVLVNSNYNIND